MKDVQSYEGQMLAQMAMPNRKQVEHALLRLMLRRDGIVREFGSGQKMVDELADLFALSESQRTIFLETVYRKEKRIKRSVLWHRLLFRAASALAEENLVSRPTQTILITGKREWMLTEKGLEKALQLCDIPFDRKDYVQAKSFEVQKIVKKLTEDPPRREDYNPLDKSKKLSKTTREFILRNRGFRQSVIEAYRCKCAVCGLQIKSPDSLFWEVEAAHIVPHHYFGRDDICNGIALCRVHHWAFDVGWFTVLDDYKIEIADRSDAILSDSTTREFFKSLLEKSGRIGLPEKRAIQPHPNALLWHRENIFHR